MVHSERRVTPPCSPAMDGFCRPIGRGAHCARFLVPHYYFTESRVARLGGFAGFGAAAYMLLMVMHGSFLVDVTGDGFGFRVQSTGSRSIESKREWGAIGRSHYICRRCDSTTMHIDLDCEITAKMQDARLRFRQGA